MSATNRGAVRRDKDLYETPPSVVSHFLQHHLKGEYQRILEPCCGSGNMVRELRKRYAGAYIQAMDICNINHIPESTFSLKGIDYLQYERDYPFDLIFTNPPYSLAQEIITHSIETWPKATVVMLLRLNFLGAQKRHKWWQKYPASDIYVMSCRPDYTGEGGDATEYAWFVWTPYKINTKIYVIWGDDER